MLVQTTLCFQSYTSLRRHSSYSTRSLEQSTNSIIQAQDVGRIVLVGSVRYRQQICCPFSLSVDSIKHDQQIQFSSHKYSFLKAQVEHISTLEVYIATTITISKNHLIQSKHEKIFHLRRNRFLWKCATFKTFVFNDKIFMLR